MTDIWLWVLVGTVAVQGLATLTLAIGQSQHTRQVAALRTEMELVHRRQRTFRRAQQTIYRQLAALQDSQMQQTQILRELQTGEQIRAVLREWLGPERGPGGTTFTGPNNITGPIAGGGIGAIGKGDPP